MELRRLAVGGARIGWFNATFPFASLSLSGNTLRIRVLWQVYTFRPEEVIAVESAGFLPLLATGVRLVHTRADYPASIIFWVFAFSAEPLLVVLRRAGFGWGAASEAVVGGQPERVFPFRAPFLVVTGALWSALFLADMAGVTPRFMNARAQLGEVVALGLVVVTTLGIRFSPRVAALALRRGVKLERVSLHVTFVGFVAAVMLGLITTCR